MFDDKKNSTQRFVLQKCDYIAPLIRCIKLAQGVFKSLNNPKLNFMNKMSQVKDISDNLRDSNILCQPKFNQITYDKDTVTYYGTYIWKPLPNNKKIYTPLDNNFKTLLKHGKI